jgi:hypothetical protein
MITPILSTTFKSALIFSVCFLTGALAGHPSVLNGQTTDSASPKKTETKQEESSDADDKAPEPISVKVADDNLQFSVTGTWKAIPPKSRMLEAELQIPRVGKDEQDGRLTIMGAGGSIEANIDRWKQQFTQPDGSDTNAKVEKKTISGQTVNIVDITGTFLDSVGGPFSGQPKVEKENYRMLAAIIETKQDGNYFVKLYGPKSTIDKNADHFKAMIESLKVVE